MCVQILICVVCLLYLTEGGDPPGHLQPLGRHVTPQTVDVLNEFPHPADFYENYVKPGKPVLFKSVLQKSDFKPFTTWNDKYLREKFGRYVVDVERGKKENREEELVEMTFRKFLDTYTQDDIYLVQDLTPKMMDDVSLPYILRCGGPQDLLFKAIIWFSSGGTKSVLHMDVFDNVNCLLDGSKHLVFFDKYYGPDIESEGYEWEGSYSTVDVDRVDMYKFPQLRDMPWYQAHMEKGDCMFIPSKWYHQVNSEGSRNMAVNLWFYHIYWFNTTHCSQDDTWKETNPITKYGFAELGESLRHMILEPLDIEQDSIGLEDFLDRWQMISIDTEATSKLFHHLDNNDDGVLTWDELYAFHVEKIYKKFPKAFGNDFREQYREKKYMLEMLSERKSEEEPDLLKEEL